MNRMSILMAEDFNKKMQVGVLILAIIFKTAFCYYYFQLEEDKLKQVIAGKNLVEGHGLTINEVRADNLSVTLYEPIIGWPPGYSLIFALLHIFIKDFTWCCMILDFISIAFFFIVISRIMALLSFPASFSNLLMLFFGLEITSYLSTSTDLMAMALCLYGIYLTMDFVENRVRPFGSGIVIGAVAILPAFVRYMYLPVSFIIPLVLWWNGSKRKLPAFITCGRTALAVAVTGVLGLLVFQKYYTGYATYAPHTLPAETGFFWKNILYTDPFIFSSIVNVNFLQIQVALYTGISYTSIFLFLRIVHWPLLIWLVYRFIKFAIRQKAVFESNWQVFTGLAGFFSIAIFGVLVLLSVTHSIHIDFVPPIRWTYVLENRYYAFITTIFPLLIVWFIFIRPYFTGTVNVRMRVVCIILLSLDMLHGGYFLLKHFGPDNHETSFHKMTGADTKFVRSFIAENKFRNIEVAVSGLNDTYAAYAALYGGKGIFDYQELNRDSIFSEKPVKILLIAQKEQFVYFNGFLSRKEVRLEKRINEKYFFSLYLPGNK